MVRSMAATVRILSLLAPSWVIVGKLLHLSVPIHLENGDNNRIYLIRLFCEMK